MKRMSLLAALLTVSRLCAATPLMTQPASAPSAKPIYRSLCAKHMESLSSDSIHEIKSIAFTAPPNEAKKEASRRYKGTSRIFLELPLKDIHFKAMYGDEVTVTAKDAHEMRDLEQKIASGPGLKAHDGLSASKFKENIQSGTKEGIVIVVGHNEDGLFRFIDGSSDDLADLANICSAAGQLCVFVSCNAYSHLLGSNSVGLDREIGFAQSVDLAQSIVRFLSAHQDTGTSAEEIQNFVRGIKRDEKKVYETKLIAFEGCGEVEGRVVIAVYVHAIPPSCKEGKAKCT